jgi:hypothetical protein
MDYKQELVFWQELTLLSKSLHLFIMSAY